MYGDRDLPFNLLVPTGRWTLKTLAILAALLMVLGALLVLSAPGQAAGQDPFVSAVSIEGNTLVPVDPLQVGPYTEGESTSGTFRVNFNRPIDLKSVTVSESVSHEPQATQVGFSSDKKVLAIYVPGALKPQTFYDISVTVESDGQEWSYLLRIKTGDASPSAVDLVIPPSGTTDVPPDEGGIFIHYNSLMNPATFNPDAFTISDLTDNAPVPSNNIIYADHRFVGMGIGILAENHLFRVDASAGLESVGGQIPEDTSILFSTNNIATLPPGVRTYPSLGSTVDGRSPVFVRVPGNLAAETLSGPRIWEGLGLPLTVFEDTVDFFWQEANPGLVVGVPTAAAAFDLTQDDTVGTFANLVTQQDQQFPGFAWGWDSSRPEQSFTDVPVSDPYYPWISTIQSNNIINGIPNGDGTLRFGGSQTLTRAQGAKIVVNAFGITVDPNATATPFLDLPAADANGYPNAFVNAGVQNGMIQGKSATSFAPSDPLTYRQVVLMTVRKLQRDYVPTISGVFSNPSADYDIGWGFPEANWAAWNGLLIGLGTKDAENTLGDPSTVNPYAPITRNDAAVIAGNLTALRQMAQQAGQ